MFNFLFYCFCVYLYLCFLCSAVFDSSFLMRYFPNAFPVCQLIALSCLITFTIVVLAPLSPSVFPSSLSSSNASLVICHPPTQTVGCFLPQFLLNHAFTAIMLVCVSLNLNRKAWHLFTKPSESFQVSFYKLLASQDTFQIQMRITTYLPTLDFQAHCWCLVLDLFSYERLQDRFPVKWRSIIALVQLYDAMRCKEFIEIIINYGGLWEKFNISVRMQRARDKIESYESRLRRPSHIGSPGMKLY